VGRKKLPPEVAEFIESLPADRRDEVAHVRDVILAALPPGYEEVVTKGMLVYQVPRERYPDTYNGQPLWYAALASEKSYLSLHLMPVYGDPASARRLAEGFKAAGKRLDIGKACVRFKRADDLALDVVGEIVAKIPLERWVELAKAARRRPRG
jgi:hypothetical protein